MAVREELGSLGKGSDQEPTAWQELPGRAGSTFMPSWAFGAEAEMLTMVFSMFPG